MRITKLAIQNFLGIKTVNLELSNGGALLIAGKMEQGKTAILDAVRLALLGDPGRVSKKKDWPALLRTGATKGLIEIEGVTNDAAWSTRTTLPSGSIKSAGAIWPQHHHLAPLVLNPTTFARLDASARRETLLSLMRVDTSGNEITRRLILKECDNEKVHELAETLSRFGAPRALEIAIEKTRQARADWKALTGEDYGDVKGETWVPTVPSAPEGTTLNGILIELKAVTEDIGNCQQEIGRLEAQRIAYDSAQAMMNGLRQKVGLGERAIASLATAQRDLHDMRARIESMEKQAALAAGPERVRPCPACGVELEDDGERLIEHQHRTRPPMPEDYGRLAEWREAASMLERAVQNHTRTRDDAQSAQATLDELEKNLSEKVTQEDIDDVRAAVKKLQDRQRQLSTLETQHLNHDGMVNKASAIRDRAAAQHRHVQQWKVIAEHLSPDGIPGEILTEGLDPFRARLRQSAIRTGWPVVNVRDDMEITIADLPYGLCSDSAKWRADATIAEAISHLSGLQLLALNGIDILDNAGRVALIGWLTTLIRAGELDQVIANGTFKTRPSGLPPEWNVQWIEAGEIEQTEEVTA